MYDKAEKVMRNLSSIIFDLRAENESLYDTIEMYSGRIDELREENEQLRTELNTLKLKVEKAIEYIENKISFETYQHLKKLYDDIDSVEEIWEDYEFEDLLNILSGGNNER